MTSELLSLKIVCVLANSVDPDEMLRYAAFHLGLHCLPNDTFRSHQVPGGGGGGMGL